MSAWEEIIEGKIETLEDQLNTHYEIITTLRNRLKSLKEKISDLEAGIKEIKSYTF